MKERGVCLPWSNSNSPWNQLEMRGVWCFPCLLRCWADGNLWTALLCAPGFLKAELAVQKLSGTCYLETFFYPFLCKTLSRICQHASSHKYVKLFGSGKWHVVHFLIHRAEFRQSWSLDPRKSFSICHAYIKNNICWKPETCLQCISMAENLKFPSIENGIVSECCMQ